MQHKSVVAMKIKGVYKLYGNSYIFEVHSNGIPLRKCQFFQVVKRFSTFLKIRDYGSPPNLDSYVELI